MSASWLRGEKRYIFETDLRYEYATWRSEELKLGSLDTQHLRMSQRYWFTKSQALSLSIPIGHFTRYTRDEAPSSEFGLGDGSALYLFNLLNNTARSERLSVSLFTGITIPSGRYSRDQLFTQTMVNPQGDGQLAVNTFNAQTSLGAGVWSAALGLMSSWRLNQALSIYHELSGASPLTETPDGITWGADLSTRLGVRWSWSSNSQVWLSGAWLKHLEDRVPNDEIGRAVRVGGRQQLSSELGFTLKINHHLRSDFSMTYNPWVRVNTPQLVQRFGAQLACLISWGGSQTTREIK